MIDPLADHEFPTTYNGQTYNIAVYNVRSDVDGKLMYDVVVTNAAGGAVVFADDFEVVNPPIMVPDGTYTDFVDEDGAPQHVANMKEDLVAAFESFTIEAVLLNFKRVAP